MTSEGLKVTLEIKIVILEIQSHSSSYVKRLTFYIDVYSSRIFYCYGIPAGTSTIEVM